MSTTYKRGLDIVFTDDRDIPFVDVETYPGKQDIAKRYENVTPASMRRIFYLLDKTYAMTKSVSILSVNSVGSPDYFYIRAWEVF